MLKTYKIRSFQNGKNKSGKPFMNYSITIPATIAEKLPEDIQFSVELTEDGLLFRRAEASQDTVQVPSWAQRSGNGSSAPAEKAKPAAKATRKAPGTNGKAKPAAKAKAAPKSTPKADPKPAAKATTRKRPAADAKPATKASGARKRPGAKA